MSKPSSPSPEGLRFLHALRDAGAVSGLTAIAAPAGVGGNLLNRLMSRGWVDAQASVPHTYWLTPEGVAGLAALEVAA